MRRPVFETRFDEELVALEPDFQRANELIRGLVWVLCRNPEFGTEINPRDRLWMVASVDVFEKQAVIYYTFTDTHIYFLSIRLVDEAEEPG